MLINYKGLDYHVIYASNGWQISEQITDGYLNKVTNKKLRKKLRQMYNTLSVPTPLMEKISELGNQTYCGGDIIIGNWALSPTKTLEQEKEYNMGFNEYNLETEQRNHLKRRLERVYEAQTDKLDKTYNLTFEGKTQEDILAALKAGNVEFEKYFFNKDGQLSPGYRAEGSFYLVNTLADKAGAAKAREAIQAAYTAAKDTILVMPLADGLKALQDFEAKTF